MADLSYAFCPSCTIESKGEANVEEVFGFRNNAGYIMVQSYCKQCRSRENVMRRKAGLIKHHKKKLKK